MKKKVVFLSGSIIAIIAIVVWFLLCMDEKEFEYPAQDVFSLDVKYDDQNIIEGQEIIFETVLTNLSDKDYIIRQPSKIITYEVDGEEEIMTSEAIYKTFEKKENYARAIHLILEESGVHEIIIVAHFDIQPSLESAESKEYIISKPISIEVNSKNSDGE